MTATLLKESAPAAPPAARARILDVARDHLFNLGYTAFTMDGLAAELGMSKKTLYVHFRSKDAIIEAVLARFVADVRASADRLFNDPSLSFPLKLHRFTEFMVRRFAGMNPHVFRDLQRSAPHIYRHIEELRHRNIPRVFGQIVRQGQAAGMVRADLDPAFAIEFLRPAIQSLMHPDTLERLQLPPDRIFPQAIALFFNGLLTSAGRKDYEKNPPA